MSRPRECLLQPPPELPESRGIAALDETPPGTFPVPCYYVPQAREIAQETRVTPPGIERSRNDARISEDQLAPSENANPGSVSRRLAKRDSSKVFTGGLIGIQVWAARRSVFRSRPTGAEGGR
jgi:hypothetical protein